MTVTPCTNAPELRDGRNRDDSAPQFGPVWAFPPIEGERPLRQFAAPCMAWLWQLDLTEQQEARWLALQLEELGAEQRTAHATSWFRRMTASWSPDRVAHHLGMSPRDVTEMARAGELVAWLEQDGFRYPEWQFQPDGLISSLGVIAGSIRDLTSGRHGLVRTDTHRHNLPTISRATLTRGPGGEESTGDGVGGNHVSVDLGARFIGAGE